MYFLLTSPTLSYLLDQTESNYHQQRCNPCLNISNLCSNNSTCRPTSLAKYTCDCLPAYHGEYCEKIIDGCSSNPCKQQGTCQSLAEGHFRCHCIPGFTGNQCEINVNDCTANHCQNNGTCIDKIDDYSCVCSPLFTGNVLWVLKRNSDWISFVGKYCEEKLNWCDGNRNPCKNNGHCSRTENGYK